MTSLRPAAVLVCATLLFAPAAHAAEPPPPAPAQARMQAETEAFFRAAAVWNQSLDARLDQEGTFLMSLQEGMGQAFDFANNQDSKAGAAWAAQWVPARQGELAALEQQAGALGPPPPPPASFQNAPRVLRMVQGMKDTTQVMRQLMSADHALAGRIILLAGEAAGGDAKAAVELANHALDVSEATVNGEIAVLQSSAASQDDGHPEKDVLESSVAAGRALLAVLEHAKAVMLTDGSAPSAAPYSARVRAQAEVISRAAALMPGHADKMLEILRRAPEISPEQYARAEKAVATYAESADLDRRLAEVLTRIADRMDAGDAMDDPRLSAAMDELSALSEKRKAVDAARVRTMVGT